MTINTSPAWWDGTIAIALTPEQWNHIVGTLAWDVTSLMDEHPVDTQLIRFISEIINRIEQNIESISSEYPF